MIKSIHIIKTLISGSVMYAANKEDVNSCHVYLLSENFFKLHKYKKRNSLMYTLVFSLLISIIALTSIFSFVLLINFEKLKKGCIL